jgi:hypothetical protein
MAEYRAVAAVGTWRKAAAGVLQRGGSGLHGEVIAR